jgi:uncharacterized glyoxalase superfamily protein PhnB
VLSTPIRRQAVADDVDRAFAGLQSAGVTTVQPPHDTGNNNRNALVRDPDGNLLELVSKRHAAWSGPLVSWQ